MMTVVYLNKGLWPEILSILQFMKIAMFALN